MIWGQTMQQPHHFHVSPTLILQLPRRTDLLQVTIEIEFEQIARIVPRPPRVGPVCAFKPQPCYVQTIYKRIDHAANVVLRNQFVQGQRKQCCLRPTFASNEAHKRCPHALKGDLAIVYVSEVS